MMQVHDQDTTDTLSILTQLGCEIRTSVNSVLGMAELLVESKLSLEQQSYVDVLRYSADRLLSSTSDIMIAACGASGIRETPVNIQFNLPELLQQIGDLWGVLAQAGGPHPTPVSVRLDPTIPDMACGDRRRLEQVLITTIRAVAGSDSSGTVALYAQLDENPTHALFCITGPGGCAVDPSTIQTVGKIVYELGGSLWTQTRGSELVVSLSVPIFGHAATGPNVVPVNPDRRKAQRILLAEDTPDNQLLIKLYLRSEACEVDVVENGLLATAATEKQDYDLILMDLDMPELDGFGATARIRTSERLRGKIPVPIVALTAHVSEETVEKCRALGFSGYLTKPVAKRDIMRVLALD